MAEKKQIEAMKALGFSDEEIAQVLADDKEIDRGKRMSFDLSPEEEKKAKKYINADEHKKPATATKKERKANPTKGGIIAELADFLINSSAMEPENVEITNKERQIAFKIGENSYELTLIQKRKPKN